MSVIVKGMDTPVSGARYRVVEDLEGNKYLATDKLFKGVYYPIVFLPEKHGRLIDGDELADGCDAPHWCRWLSEIEDMPTIVEPEG